MSSCLVKPALYVVQRTGPRVRLVDQSMASPDPGQEEEGDTEQDTGSTYTPTRAVHGTLEKFTVRGEGTYWGPAHIGYVLCGKKSQFQVYLPCLNPHFVL